MRRRAGRGFTLVELIVTLAVVMILGTGLAMIAQPAFTTARESSFLSEDRQIAQSIMQQLKRELAAAGKGSVSVTAGGDGVSFRSETYGNLTVSNAAGHVSVMCGTQEIGLEDGAYMGRTAEAAFALTGTEMTITVNVLRSGEQTATLTETVRLMNE